MFSRKVIILFLFFLSLCIKSQTLDSIINLYKNAKHDTDKIKYAAKLSWEYRQLGSYKEAFDYAQQALEKSQQINYVSGIANGSNALAAVYDDQGNYPKALNYYLNTLKIHEQLNDSLGICRDYNNIGLLYCHLSNYKTALEYYSKGIQLAEILHNNVFLSALYFNIGSVYTYTEKYKESTECYLKSLSIDTILKDDYAISDCYTNIGINYNFSKDYDKALFYCFKGLTMKKALQDFDGAASGYINIADVFVNKHDYKSAKAFLDSSLTISEENQSFDNLRLTYKGLADVHFKLGNFRDAYLYHVKFKQITDSIFNNENNEQLNQTKINFELEKKRAEQLQQKALTDADKKRQNIIILSVVLVLLIVSVFSLFLFKRFKITNQQKEIISQQKELVEEKQKEISDSINYAKRIQTSFLANELEFKKYFADYFILFNPKDIVSGDFYWTASVDSKFYVAVADSTGHGIPGAFMSLLNISLLNEAVLSKNYSSTVDILNFVRRILILGLKPDESGQGGNDGMDCVLISIDFKTMEMEFSGANNPLWIVREGAIIELKPDKMPVGRSPKEFVSFTSQKFQVQKGDLIYSFTDGYADQFGGPKGKKFKYKQLEEMLLKNHQYVLSLQKETLHQTFINWKNSLEQVDDITILGFKI